VHFFVRLTVHTSRSACLCPCTSSHKAIAPNSLGRTSKPYFTSRHRNSATFGTRFLSQRCPNAMPKPFSAADGQKHEEEKHGRCRLELVTIKNVRRILFLLVIRSSSRPIRCVIHPCRMTVASFAQQHRCKDFMPNSCTEEKLKINGEHVLPRTFLRMLTVGCRIVFYSRKLFRRSTLVSRS
jgi:hypothetical protein